jgi:hypothetical protein
MPHCIPFLQVNHVGEKAVRTALKALRYIQRAWKRKGFSNEPEVMAVRVEFAQDGITWLRQRV